MSPLRKRNLVADTINIQPAFGNFLAPPWGSNTLYSTPGLSQTATGQQKSVHNSFPEKVDTNASDTTTAAAARPGIKNRSESLTGPCGGEERFHNSIDGGPEGVAGMGGDWRVKMQSSLRFRLQQHVERFVQGSGLSMADGRHLAQVLQVHDGEGGVCTHVHLP